MSKLKAIRDKLRLNQTQFGDLILHTQSYISRIEKKDDLLTVRDISEIMEKTKCNLSDILPDNLLKMNGLKEDDMRRIIREELAQILRNKDTE
jgi:predicted transcriptional regulator